MKQITMTDKQYDLLRGCVGSWARSSRNANAVRLDRELGTAIPVVDVPNLALTDHELEQLRGLIRYCDEQFQTSHIDDAEVDGGLMEKVLSTRRG